jgi:hypothetical protein
MFWPCRNFFGCVRTDARGIALFPHYDWEGLCGFEVKNHSFTGFSAGGSKGLWFSKAEAAATRLVLAESAIDAISFHVLNPSPGVRYLSIGGNMNHGQPELIRSAMEKMAPGLCRDPGLDYDEAGEELAEEVTALAPSSVEVQRILPPVGHGKDWNEVLKLNGGSSSRHVRHGRPDFGKTRPLRLCLGRRPESPRRASRPKARAIGKRNRRRAVFLASGAFYSYKQGRGRKDPLRAVMSRLLSIFGLYFSLLPVFGFC